MSDPQKPKPWNVSGDRTVSGSTSGSSPAGGLPPKQAGVDRPLGITIVCMVNFIVAGLFLLLIVLVLTSGPGDKSIAIAAFLPVIISLGLGVALWQMLPWARNTALVLYGVYALSALFGVFKPNVQWTDILSVLVPAGIAAYLLQPSVQAAFDKNVKR